MYFEKQSIIGVIRRENSKQHKKPKQFKLISESERERNGTERQTEPIIISFTLQWVQRTKFQSYLIYLPFSVRGTRWNIDDLTPAICWYRFKLPVVCIGLWAEKRKCTVVLGSDLFGTVHFGSIAATAPAKCKQNTVGK